jgi:hypothetical protein
MPGALASDWAKIVLQHNRPLGDMTTKLVKVFGPYVEQRSQLGGMLDLRAAAWHASAQATAVNIGARRNVQLLP